MNQEQHTFSETPIVMSFDDFEISAESFKPVTKGLGFHQDQKKTNFKPVIHAKIETSRISGPLTKISQEIETKINKQAPMGLEAFYGAASPQTQTSTEKEIKLEISKPFEIPEDVPAIMQFSAWLIDLAVVLALVAITAACLVLASGLNYSLISKLVTKSDLILFSATIFSIYYILYFTILDLSGSPGKIILGIKLTTTDSSQIAIKNTFTRSLVSLLSILGFCLPMLLDFQGRLSDTKIEK
jgi:uncharacterized RDD family membrane protein YckC